MELQYPVCGEFVQVVLTARSVLQIKLQHLNYLVQEGILGPDDAEKLTEEIEHDLHSLDMVRLSPTVAQVAMAGIRKEAAGSPEDLEALYRARSSSHRAWSSIK